MREALEMRYLWQVPLRLDNTKLQALIGEETHTSLDQAIKETLFEIGCLSAPDSRSMREAVKGHSGHITINRGTLTDR
jgi:hypothetical protein